MARAASEGEATGLVVAVLHGDGYDVWVRDDAKGYEVSIRSNEDGTLVLPTLTYYPTQLQATCASCVRAGRRPRLPRLRLLLLRLQPLGG